MSTEPDNAGSSDNDEGYVTDSHVLVEALGDHPQTKMLAVFIGNPEMDFNVTEIAKYADLKRDTVYKYLGKLKELDLIEEARKVGNSQMYALNTDNDAAETFAKFEWDLVKNLAESEE